MTEERLEEIRRYMLDEGPRSIEGDWAVELWQEVDSLRRRVATLEAEIERLEDYLEDKETL